MSRTSAARACALILAAAFSGACGGGENDSASTTTTSAAGSGTSTSTGAGTSTTMSTTTTSDATQSDATQTIDVTYAGGQVSGGVRTETVRVGDQVVLRVTSDVAEEVHVHTYDVTAEVAPGRTQHVRFTATIPGRFEVELEKKGKQLLVLEVR